jgi:hypothetical protein
MTTAPASDDDTQRDAMTAIQDHTLEMSGTAIFFGFVIAHGVPDGMTLAQVQAIARRFIESKAPVYRYWKGKEISGPEHEAEGARQ